MPEQLSVDAPAKINLSLEIVGRRPDGFHDLISVMQTVTLADHLYLYARRGVSLSCSSRELNRPDNLALRAAHLVRDRLGIDRGCHIDLEKRIPHAAGLGGGSSDAAAVLLALTRLWDVSLPREELMRLAAELGSDVPFFLYGGTALVEGRGECITSLPDPARQWYVLVKPPIKVPTRDIFAALSPGEWTDGARTRSIAHRVRSNSRVGVGVNGLQETLFRLYPDVRAAHDDVQSRVQTDVIVSGSGPTMLLPFSSEQEAQAARRSLDSGYWSEVVSQAPPSGKGSPCV